MDDTKIEISPSTANLNKTHSYAYSVQCFIDWIDAIETNDKIIELNFDKIEQDLKQQLETGKAKCKDLFYPNIQSHYTCDDKPDHKKDQNKIENWYQKLFAAEPSIIHYILYNKSFLYSLPNPDIDKQQSKLDNIKTNSADLIHLNMQQSIYILRLLLFKYQVILPTAIFEDNWTIMFQLKKNYEALSFQIHLNFRILLNNI